MRRPIHNLRFAAGVVLCGTAGMLLSFAVPTQRMSPFMQHMLPGAAGLVMARGFVAALVLYPFARSFTRLRSGASVVARWVVEQRRATYPAAVKRFRRKNLAALALFVLIAGAWLLVFGSGL